MTVGKTAMPLFPDFLRDVDTITAPVPAALEGATHRGVLWQAAQARFMLELHDVARYLIEGGERVTVDPAKGASPVEVARFARTTPLAALLYQRGVLAFHAAAAADERGAVLLAGDSGCGKSTLLMALMQRGWTPLSDDLSVVAREGESDLLVQPTFPELALWPAALERFGWDPGKLERADVNRLLLPPTGGGPVSRQQLRAICWLGVHGNSAIDSEVVSGAELFRAVGALLYNSQIASALLDRRVYMGYAAHILRGVPVFRLQRPRGRWSADEVADLIEKLT